MERANREIFDLEGKIKRHREYTKARSELIRSNQKAVFEEFKLKYENNNSIVDYLLSILRQFLALSVTGYLGLLVLPSSILGNVMIVQKILLATILIALLLILLFLIAKISFSNEVNNIINERIAIQDSLMRLESECQTFTEEQLNKIIEIRNKDNASE